ncbi:FAD-binding type 2 [Penicillium cf. griseofulvum]|nr:FAD-binding type 2 [Penicillium cf. griseofulvum]
MAIRFWPFLISVIAAAARSPNGDTDPLCRNIPGDKGWPNQGAWHRLNNTVGGRLIETVPLAHICHDTGIYPAFNEPACEDLQEAFNEAGAHTLQPQPGEFMNAYFLNTSCSPFTPKSVPCELGNRAVYSINVTGPTDVQAGMKFASENNIRLVVKSTGIDYMGKSTGYGALSLWMYNLKTIDVIPDYLPNAVSAGLPGVICKASATRSSLPNTEPPPTRSLNGNLSPPAGKYLTATPKKNKDLYWALAGGGGGTYGVVLSVTIKAYPDGPVAGGTLVVNNTNDAAFWEAIGSWFHRGPSFVENSPNNVQFLVRNATLQVFSLVLPDQESSAVDALVSPFIDDLKRLNLPYELKTGQAPTYADSLVSSYGPLPYGNLCPSFPVISSRLIPRATVLNTTSNAELMDAYRSITADGKWFIGCSFINVEENSPIRGPHPPNSVHPAWRKAIAYCNPNNPWDWEDPAKSLALKKQLVDEFFPAIEAATPGSGVNLNEMDPWYKGDWKQTMYGDNYQRLLKIKHDHDPHRLMYGHFAVGADEFTLDKDNRLCRVR